MQRIVEVDGNMIHMMYQQWVSWGVGENLLRRLIGQLTYILGRGSCQEVSDVLGVNVKTITKGRHEVFLPLPRFPLRTKTGALRVRKPGGGRHTIQQVVKDEQGVDINEMVTGIVAEDGGVAGSPVDDLKYKDKSFSNVAGVLVKVGIFVSRPTVGKILHEEGFSGQKNRKVLPVGRVPDWRDQQFHFISYNIAYYNTLPHAAIVSVDSLRKIMVGPFANNGKEWARSGQPIKVADHDYRTGVPVVTPHGAFDMKTNVCYMTLGLSHDTPLFAISCLNNYILAKRKEDPLLNRILILCDGGGSNSSRSNVWKLGLFSLANTYSIEIAVCHYPPYCSKYNPIEHRVFPFIVINMRAKPLIDLDTVQGRIANTTNSTGLKVLCDIDYRTYETGVSVNKKLFEKEVNIVRAKELGQVNYLIIPNRKAAS